MISGVTDNGFVRPDLSEIEAHIEDKIITLATDESGNEPNMVAPEFWGVMKGLAVALYDEGIQDSEDVYYAQFISTAIGAALDKAVYPTLRKPANQSIGTLTFAGGLASGTILNTEVFETEDGRKYSLDADLDLDGSGDGSAAAHSVEDGIDQNAPINAVRFIPVPITDMPFLTVTNEAAFLDGQNIETDTILRARAILFNALEKTSSLPAIEGALLQVDGVIAVLGYENITEIYEGSIPPGGILMTVKGGTDADVAAAIYTTKPAGNPTHGDVSISVDSLQHDIKFSRVTSIPIYIDATLTTDGDYNPSESDDVIRLQILRYIGGVTPGSVTYEGADIGEDIYAFKCGAACFELINKNLIPGLLSMSVKIGISALDINYDSIVIATTEEATVDFSDIALL